MLNLLTTIIGTVAKGKAAKAIAGGVAAGMSAVSATPLIDALIGGFLDAGTPQAREIGMLAGQAVFGYIGGFVVTWLAPKNAAV